VSVKSCLGKLLLIKIMNDISNCVLFISSINNTIRTENTIFTEEFKINYLHSLKHNKYDYKEEMYEPYDKTYNRLYIWPPQKK
jgi:hypothetical protein